jgi:ribonuclease P protein component
MLPRQHRLTRSRDFTAVLRGGRGAGDRRRAGTRLLVVHLRQDPEAAERPPRVGFVVSRTVGNSVVRHRVVRRLRHLVAPRLSDLPAGTDLVIRAQPEAARASSAELAVALHEALDRVTR